MTEHAVRHRGGGDWAIRSTPGEAEWGPVRSRFQWRGIEHAIPAPVQFPGGCEDCLAIDEETPFESSELPPDAVPGVEFPAPSIGLQAGQLSFLLLMSLFRKLTLPWPHFLLLLIAIAASLGLVWQGDYAASLTAVFGAAIFLATWLSSVWVRRKMRHV